MKQKLTWLCLALLWSVNLEVGSQTFDEWFTPQTLRVDYIFAGDSATQSIYLDKMARLPHWAGRRVNLDSLYLEGNGRFTLRDEASGRIIYRNAFSTLFQEWQATPEATNVRKSFENPSLCPSPKSRPS